jgi:hypothetical protein
MEDKIMDLIQDLRVLIVKEDRLAHECSLDHLSQNAQYHLGKAEGMTQAVNELELILNTCEKK